MFQKYSFRFVTSFGGFFSSMALSYVREGGISLYGSSGHFSAGARALVDQREKRAKAVRYLKALCSAFREVNVTKEVGFWLPGQDNPAQIPKEPSVKGTVDGVS